MCNTRLGNDKWQRSSLTEDQCNTSLGNDKWQRSAKGGGGGAGMTLWGSDSAQCCVCVFLVLRRASKAVAQIPMSTPSTANPINSSQKGNSDSWLVTSPIRTAGGLISDQAITS